MTDGTHKSRMKRPILRRTIRILHLVWAIPCITIGALLSQATEGHPPGIILIPVVFVVWVIGHLTLLAARVLAERGATVGMVPARWPLSVIIAVVASGALAFVGFFAILATLLTGDGIAPSLFPFVIPGWLLHGAAFVGLLLRQSWARLLAGGLSAGWGLLMLYQIVDHISYGRPIDISGLLLATAIIVAFGILATRLVIGRATRRYTGDDSTATTDMSAPVDRP